MHFMDKETNMNSVYLLKSKKIKEKCEWKCRHVLQGTAKEENNIVWIVSFVNVCKTLFVEVILFSFFNNKIWKMFQIYNWTW